MARFSSLTEGKAWRLAGVLAAASISAACHFRTTEAAPPEAGDRPVARVDGQTVWASDVRSEAVAEGAIGPNDPLPPTSDAFRKALDEVIDAKVLAAAAVARGLDRTPAAQRRLEAARERTLEDLMVEAVVGRTVNDRAENALYQEYLKYRTDAGPPQPLAALKPQLVRFITYDQIKDLVLRLRGRSKIVILTPPAARSPGSKP